jgi:hypothetical protein
MPLLFAEAEQTSLLDVLSQQLSRIHGNDLTAVFVVGMMLCFALVISLAAIITDLIQKHRKRELVVRLVQDMLDRGIAPDDVVRILSAAGLENMGHRMLDKLGKLVSGAAAPKEHVQP